MNCDELAPQPEPARLDVLFVVDNSGSMKEEQDAVAANLTSFVAALQNSGGVTQDLQVGVITTSVYQHYKEGTVDIFTPFPAQSGKLQTVGGSKFLDSSDPAFISKFAQLVQQGTSGSGQETPFEAIRLFTLDPANAGFLRAGARLLIVVLSDEDDCSERLSGGAESVVTVGTQTTVDYCQQQSGNLSAVADYYDVLKGLNRELIYAAIGPVGITTKAAQGTLEAYADGGMHVANIDCKTSFEPGYRHRAMAERFYADLSNLASICSTDYQQMLLDIASLTGVEQSIALQGVTDPRLLKVVITRRDGATQECTLAGGGFTYEAPRINFSNTCNRRRDDVALEIQRLCIY